MTKLAKIATKRKALMMTGPAIASVRVSGLEPTGERRERTIMAGITLANHGDAGLVEVKAVYLTCREANTNSEGRGTYQDTNTECGIHVRKGACDRIMRGIEQGDGECSDEDSSGEPGKPG
jgi:hypothetical protein